MDESYVTRLENVGLEIAKAMYAVRDEIAALRQAYEPARLINEFNWKQIESITQGGIVGVNAMPGPPPNGPRRM